MFSEFWENSAHFAEKARKSALKQILTPSSLTLHTAQGKDWERALYCILHRRNNNIKEVFIMKTNAKKPFNVRQLVVLGLMTALVMIFSFTPIGSIPVGPLVITLNVIPVAVAGITCGPLGGGIIGGVFGLFSFLQCINIGIPSAMGAALFDINPFFAFVQRFLPRVLVGIIAGYSFKAARKLSNNGVGGAVAGFMTAFSNTALFMTALVLLFGNTGYMEEKMGNKNVIWFIITFVGVNAVVEMVVATVVTAAAAVGLTKAGFIKGKTA